MSGNIRLPRAEFLEALKRIVAHAEYDSPTEALIFAEETSLTFSTSTVDVIVPAEGGWIGVTRLPVQFLARMVDVLPAGDPVVIQVDSDYFKIGSLSLTCRWQKRIGERLLLPPDLGLPGLLRLSYDAPRALIEQSGLGLAVEDAEDRLDMMLETAEDALAEVGVDREDLEALVKERVRRATASWEL